MEAARRQLTVLFCNLVGSTALSRQVDPEEYADIVRAYHTACAAVIERFAGHVAQYLGDGLLVYFDYPQAQENDAPRAVYTALGILEALKPLKHQLQTTQGVQIAVRLGIHTGQVVLISGDAGIGKSRLVQALKDQVRAEAHILLECQGLPYHQHTPLWPLTALLPRLFQWQRDEPIAARLAKLASTVEQVQLPVEQTVPLLATLLTLPVPEDAYPPLTLTLEERRQKTFAALLTLVLGLATRQPVLLVVEHLHWIDPSTLAFLELLVEQSPTAALLPVVTCRPTCNRPG